MKTYTYLVGILPMVFLAACSTSTTEPLETETPIEIKADYTVLLSNNQSLGLKSIKASNTILNLGEGTITFPNFEDTEITFSDGEIFSFYNLSENCDGHVLVYDFNDNTHKSLEAFLNIDACSIEVTAIAHWGSYIGLAYIKSDIGKEDSYYVRIINTEEGDATAVDVSLDLKPLGLSASNGKLFVLTIDDQITDENGLSVIDLVEESIIFEKMLGYNAKRIFKDSDGNIIISYPELHTTLNNSNFSEAYTQYGATLRPELFSSPYYFFDLEDNLYYIKKTETEVSIPAFYDFQQNKVILYYFENYLTDQQLNTELNIQSATAVGFDAENNFILVGYRQKDNTNLGGILRLTPTPDFSYVDHIDLDGIPKAILVE